MKRIASWSLILAVALLAMPQAAHAFGYSGVGGKLGYSGPEDLDGTASLGLHAELAHRTAPVLLVPNMMYWKVDGVRDLNPNLDLVYSFDRADQVRSYLGGGLGINFFRNDRTDRSDSDLGLNFVGGLRFPGAANHFFLEGRYTESEIPQASVMMGVTFHAR
jgi:hypothetical protein